MQARTLQTWIVRRIAIRHRLERVCTSYLLFLMVVATKHPRRSRPVFRTAQISILEDVASPQQGRSLYAGEPLQETSQAHFPSPAKAERAALDDGDCRG